MIIIITINTCILYFYWHWAWKLQALCWESVCTCAVLSWGTRLGNTMVAVTLFVTTTWRQRSNRRKPGHASQVICYKWISPHNQSRVWRQVRKPAGNTGYSLRQSCKCFFRVQSRRRCPFLTLPNLIGLHFLFSDDQSRFCFVYLSIKFNFKVQISPNFDFLKVSFQFLGQNFGFKVNICQNCRVRPKCVKISQFLGENYCPSDDPDWDLGCANLIHRVDMQ